MLTNHELLFDSLIDPTPSLLQEVLIVEQRYKLLSSKLYHLCVKHPLMIRGFKNYVRFLAKAGLIRQKVSLKREINLDGSDYETIKKSN